MTKYCSRCRRALPLTAFHRHTGRWDGLQAWCKACMREDRRRRYARQRGYQWVERARVTAAVWPPAARG